MSALWSVLAIVCGSVICSMTIGFIGGWLDDKLRAKKRAFEKQKFDAEILSRYLQLQKIREDAAKAGYEFVPKDKN